MGQVSEVSWQALNFILVGARPPFLSKEHDENIRMSMGIFLRGAEAKSREMESQTRPEVGVVRPVC